jgi:uncharacterized membrane protein
VSWSRRFRVREQVLDSLWIVPLAGSVLGALLGFAVAEIDRHVHVPAEIQYSSSTASTLLTAIVGAAAALTGFVVTVTTLIVPMVIGTFSPRYMRLWYRDPLLKATLALVAGTLTFAFALLRRIEPNFVPNVGVTVAGVLMVASLMVFLYFFSRAMTRLRPVAVAAFVARAGRAAFEETTAIIKRSDVGIGQPGPGSNPTQVVRFTRAGVIQAIHLEGLVHWATRRNVQVALKHAVGDAVPIGEPLATIHGGEAGSRAEHELNAMIALGDERTIEQDPAFAIRIMVDIALMALSPAVNAPTTATQVLDHLGETLRVIGTTDLDHLASSAVGDTPPAVVMPIQRWEDYLTLGVTEIREFGASGIQVMRALRAMLEALRDVVRAEHRAAVEDELARLDSTIAATWRDSVDRDRAGIGDAQGIGGPGLAKRVDVASNGGRAVERQPAQ